MLPVGVREAPMVTDCSITGDGSGGNTCSGLLCGVEGVSDRSLSEEIIITGDGLVNGDDEIQIGELVGERETR